METVPTTNIRTPGGVVRINASDYKPEVHGPEVSDDGTDIVPVTPAPAAPLVTTPAALPPVVQPATSPLAEVAQASVVTPATEPAALPPVTTPAAPAKTIGQVGDKWFVFNADGTKALAKGFPTAEGATEAMNAP